MIPIISGGRPGTWQLHGGPRDGEFCDDPPDGYLPLDCGTDAVWWMIKISEAPRLLGIAARSRPARCPVCDSPEPARRHQFAHRPCRHDWHLHR
jgi:hypothetical protein